MLEKSKLHINIEEITVFQSRNNVSLSMLNQRRNLMLKQRWFWVNSKTQFCSYITMVEKSKLYINVEKETVFQCRNKVNLSALNQRWNLMLKQGSFWVDSKTQSCSYITMLKKSKFYINVEKMTVFHCQNNVSLSMLNQRRNLTLKQHWFSVDSKRQFCSYIKMLEKWRLYINVEKTTAS